MIIISEIQEWESITNNRKLLHYLQKQGFKCSECGYHFKTSDKVNKTFWNHASFPMFEHLNTRIGGVLRPHIMKDHNRVMGARCHAKRHYIDHDKIFGWMKRYLV